MNSTLLTVLCLSLTVVACTASCPNNLPGHVKTSEFKGVCYIYFYNDYLPANKAEKVCQDYGSTLAMPKTNDINQHLVSNISPLGLDRNFWIGLNDKSYEGKFMWADGTPLDWNNDYHMLGTYPKTPHAVKDCVVLETSGKWTDFRCDVLGLKWRYYICQKA